MTIDVSTHSRPKAAGPAGCVTSSVIAVSTHSRPKAAGKAKFEIVDIDESFNTQPPEGGWFFKQFVSNIQHKVSTHSRPKAAGSRAKGNST